MINNTFNNSLSLPQPFLLIISLKPVAYTVQIFHNLKLSVFTLWATYTTGSTNNALLYAQSPPVAVQRLLWHNCIQLPPVLGLVLKTPCLLQISLFTFTYKPNCKAIFFLTKGQAWMITELCTSLLGIRGISKGRIVLPSQ